MQEWKQSYRVLQQVRIEEKPVLYIIFVEY